MFDIYGCRCQYLGYCVAKYSRPTDLKSATHLLGLQGPQQTPAFVMGCRVLSSQAVSTNPSNPADVLTAGTTVSPEDAANAVSQITFNI